MSSFSQVEVSVPKTANPGKAAGLVAGLILGAPAGLILVGVLTAWNPEKLLLGTAIGAAVGMFLGLLFSRFESVAAAALVGAVLPLLLIVKDGFRSGRLNARSVAELQEPKSLLIMGGILLGGALIAGLLSATAKGLRGMWDGRA